MQPFPSSKLHWNTSLDPQRTRRFQQELLESSITFESSESPSTTRKNKRQKRQAGPHSQQLFSHGDAPSAQGLSCLVFVAASQPGPWSFGRYAKLSYPPGGHRASDIPSRHWWGGAGAVSFKRPTLLLAVSFPFAFHSPRQLLCKRKSQSQIQSAVFPHISRHQIYRSHVFCYQLLRL